jgi:small ligand-binding sensory domain FIST
MAWVQPYTALVHADAGTPDVAELIAEMAARTATGYLFGGLASSRAGAVQFAVGGNGNIKGQGAAGRVSRRPVRRGLRRGIPLVSRVTQGCQPMSAQRVITAAEATCITELTVSRRSTHCCATRASPGRSARAMAALRATLVVDRGRGDAVGRTGNFGADVVVRAHHRPDPARRGVAVADRVTAGMRSGVLPTQCAGAPTWCAFARRSARNWSPRR